MANNTKRNDNFIMTSMTDLMTSLAVIFILLLVIFLNRTHIDTHKRSEEIRQKLIEQLKSKDVNAKIDPLDKLSLIIRVDDDSLSFDTDDDKIKPGGEIFLVEFIPKLTEVVCGSNNEIESILIQGFTDSEGDDNHNLGLSQKRARAVMLYSLDKTPISSRHKNCLLNFTSTNGKGERGLLSDTGKPAKTGEENKTKSRRVEFKIRVKSYEQRKIIEQLQQQDETLVHEETDIKRHIGVEPSPKPIAIMPLAKRQKEQEPLLTVRDNDTEDESNKSSKVTIDQLIMDFNNKLEQTQTLNTPTPFEFKMIGDIVTLEDTVNHNMELYLKIKKTITELQNQLNYLEALEEIEPELVSQAYSESEVLTEANEGFIQGSNKFFSFLIQNNESLKPSDSKLKLRWSVDHDEKDSIKSSFDDYYTAYKEASHKLSTIDSLK